MIIFFAEGRLGNQLFQYAFLKSIRRQKERIMVRGFDELHQTCHISDIILIPKGNRLLRIFFYPILKMVFVTLSQLRIISSVYVVYEQILHIYRRETTQYLSKKGIFSRLRYVHTGYFQSESFFDPKVIENIRIRPEHVTTAKAFFEDIPKDSYPVFVHIRRDDYKNLSIYGKSALLPISYYQKQIRIFLKENSRAYFIFLSDDTNFVEKQFSDIKAKKISTNNSFCVDFAIMMLCRGAILSPSSFSWWGSYFMENQNQVIAPKYWLGFRSGIEMPSGVVPSFCSVVTVEVV